ncbi:hypothetical protein CYMTET_19136 [Cymbomonas tetramitiformis]|uniref:Reverse transcriptase domain-containing protein n=1 Tax=Cymbomonas tetramitiformis TaxID=36881 RepID=A0AAE0G788_9CHLO|nr:hypothetical protein CYMTET_19136 [Cymbomonas tetramitiformis]
MEAYGTRENKRRCYKKECERVGFAVPLLTPRSHLVAAAFQGWHNVDFLFRSPRKPPTGRRASRATSLPHPCFEFDDVQWMDAHAPFGYRALPGIFMRWTRAIMAWKRARGVPTVGYLDVFFMVAHIKEEAEEAMMFLVKFVSFLGFKVNSAKCEGPPHVMEFVWRVPEHGGRGSARVLEDLFVLEHVARQYNGGKVVLHRLVVDERHFATEASAESGRGCSSSSSSWVDLVRMPQWPRFPKRDGVLESWTINYPEPFAAWWASVLWGHRMQGRVQKSDGHGAWDNLPFSAMNDIVINFVKCKKRQPWGTSPSRSWHAWRTGACGAGPR